jgi:DNA primase
MDPFSVNVGRNIYRCFVCHSAGNQLDLWAALRQLSLYEAARDLDREFPVNPLDKMSNPQLENPTPHHH